MDFVHQVFEVIAEAPQNTYQLLTKRARWLRRVADQLDWPSSQRLGQERDRVDDLRQIPAAIRFLSTEPLLGPLSELRFDGIGWGIAGGESGPGHGPVREEWLTEIRDVCYDSDSSGVNVPVSSPIRTGPGICPRLCDHVPQGRDPTPSKSANGSDAGHRTSSIDLWAELRPSGS